MNNHHRILRVLGIAVLSLGVLATGAANDSERLSRDIAKRTERVLEQVNEQLTQRIARDLTRRLAPVEEAAVQPVRRPVEGRARTTVSLEP